MSHSNPYTADIIKFETGATRSPLGNKPEYAGYLSAPAIKAYGAYMLKNQTQEDGSRRDSRNWRKGIPTESYIQSMWRHFFAVWYAYESGEKINTDDLCALFFNVQGLLHEELKHD